MRCGLWVAALYRNSCARLALRHGRLQLVARGHVAEQALLLAHRAIPTSRETATTSSCWFVNVVS